MKNTITHQQSKLIPGQKVKVEAEFISFDESLSCLVPYNMLRRTKEIITKKTILYINSEITIKEVKLLTGACAFVHITV